MRHSPTPRRLLTALALCVFLASCGRQAQFDRNQRAIDESIATNAANSSAPATNH